MKRVVNKMGKTWMKIEKSRVTHCFDMRLEEVFIKFCSVHLWVTLHLLSDLNMSTITKPFVLLNQMSSWNSYFDRIIYCSCLWTCRSSETRGQNSISDCQISPPIFFSFGKKLSNIFYFWVVQIMLRTIQYECSFEKLFKAKWFELWFSNFLINHFQFSTTKLPWVGWYS